MPVPQMLSKSIIDNLRSVIDNSRSVIGVSRVMLQLIVSFTIVIFLWERLRASKLDHARSYTKLAYYSILTSTLVGLASGVNVIIDVLGTIL